ncbi:hypothetical protein Pla52n_15730 [Stieleria varia]|uniref:Uncharacterized protein n=1 Tax=Stieleria varia TaxID=2528005 RepID=A0A5C6B1S7_9BACT|nr:hypothetical protein Pla52n_15730 [Stieleria varia]
MHSMTYSCSWRTFFAQREKSASSVAESVLGRLGIGVFGSASKEFWPFSELVGSKFGECRLS